MVRTTCVIAGGGPAGLMLGLLLARGGVEVTVLEKHGDFLRDFRGDTVHASTIRLLDELGLGAAFRQLPQSRLGNIQLPTPDGSRVALSDFDSLPAPYNYIAMIPQWDFLNLLADAATREPACTLRMTTEATELVWEAGYVVGLRYRSEDGDEGEIRADLTVACDGRQSELRRSAGLRPREFDVPFDTWWFRLPRHPHEQAEIAALLPDFRGDEILLTLVRRDFYQVAYLAPKGSDPRLRAEGVERFRERVARLRPQYADRVDAIESMDDVHLLDVRIDRLRTWHLDGLLCIGDAAHAMSPAGGVGINLAVQDAVAAARLLAGPLREGRLTAADLARVRRRRLWPTAIVQLAQRGLQSAIFAPTFEGKRSGTPGALLLLARRVPAFRRIPSRMIAYGPLPEHAPGFARR